MVGLREILYRLTHWGEPPTSLQDSHKFVDEALGSGSQSEKELSDWSWSITTPFSWLGNFFRNLFNLSTLDDIEVAAADIRKEGEQVATNRKFVEDHVKSMGIEKGMTYDEYCISQNFEHRLTEKDFNFYKTQLTSKEDPIAFLNVSVRRNNARIIKAKSQLKEEMGANKKTHIPQINIKQNSPLERLREFKLQIKDVDNKKKLTMYLLLTAREEDRGKIFSDILKMKSEGNLAAEFDDIYEACLELDKYLSDIRFTEPELHELQLSMLTKTDHKGVAARKNFIGESLALKRVNSERAIVEESDVNLMSNKFKFERNLEGRIRKYRYPVSTEESRAFQRLKDKYSTSWNLEDVVNDESEGLSVKCKWLAVKHPERFVQLIGLASVAADPNEILAAMIENIPTVGEVEGQSTASHLYRLDADYKKKEVKVVKDYIKESYGDAVDDKRQEYLDAQTFIPIKLFMDAFSNKRKVEKLKGQLKEDLGTSSILKYEIEWPSEPEAVLKTFMTLVSDSKDVEKMTKLVVLHLSNEEREKLYDAALEYRVTRHMTGIDKTMVDALFSLEKDLALTKIKKKKQK